MRAPQYFVLFSILLSAACEREPINRDEDIPNEICFAFDGFCILSDNRLVLSPDKFDYYDFSSHLIYLKDQKSFADEFEGLGDFTVLADGVEIYSGQTFPGYSSYMPSGAVILAQPSHYGDYILPIGYIQMVDADGTFVPDPREDIRIREALEKYDQFHSGLSCEITSVIYSSSQNVQIELRLSNPDSFDYYYLDPEKMGVPLFHYYTNGLFLRDDSQTTSHTHKVEVESPVPWDSWEMDWLSVIKSDESKVITIRYNSFENVPHGSYRATFEFPGLSHQIEKEEIRQPHGRIWLGSLNLNSDIVIE